MSPTHGVKRKARRVYKPRKVARRGSVSRPVRRKARRVNNKKKMRRNANAVKKVIKGIVQGELKCQDPAATYNKHYTGNLDLTNAEDNVDRAHSNFNKQQVNYAPHTIFSMEFTPHTSKRILDAASILFNGRPASINIEGGTTFDIKKTQINHEYCSYKVQMTNITELIYHVDVYEVTNKSSSQTNFLDTVQASMGQTNWLAPVPVISQVSTGGYGKFVPLDLEFSSLVGISQKYSIKQKNYTVKPGGKVTYFSKLGHGCLDLVKNVTQDQTELASYVKGEKQIIFRTRPMLTNTTKSPADGSAFVPQYRNLNNTDFQGFQVEVKEVFKIGQPDNTLEVHEGTKRCMLTDLTHSYGASTTQYVTYPGDYNNIVNPGT